MSLADDPPRTLPTPPVRSVAIGAITCLYVALAALATLNEPERPDPPCWYE